MQKVNEKLVEAKRSVQEWLDALHKEAENVIERHWSIIKEEEKRWSGWENKSQLRVRIDRTANAMNIGWQRVRWVGAKAKGTRKALTEYIRKGNRGYGYNMKALMKLARDWEKPIIEATEEKLTEIRRQWRHANEAMRMIRMAEKKGKAEVFDKSGESKE